MSHRHRQSVKKLGLLVLGAVLIAANPETAFAQPGFNSTPVGTGGSVRAEPGSDGGAPGDKPAAANDAAAADGPTAEQLRAVRAAAFANIDKSLGIDSHKLLQERLIAVGASGQISDAGDAGAAAPPARGGVIRKILTSKHLPMLLGLLPIGNKVDLVTGIIAILGNVVGGRAESAVPGELTEEDIAYMQDHPDDIYRALKLKQQEMAAAEEAAAAESAAEPTAIDRLIELEQLRRESQAAEEAGQQAAEEAKTREKRIQELQREVNRIRAQ